MNCIGGQKPSYFQDVDASFTVFYVTELFAQLAVHRCHYFTSKQACWNWLDFLLGVLAILDVALSSGAFNPTLLRILRFLRVTKVLRMFQLMRFFSELRLLLKCVVGSLISFMWSIVMLASFTVLFAIIIVQQLPPFFASEQGRMISSTKQKDLLTAFGSVERASFTLFKSISGGNDWDVYYTTLEKTGTVASMAFMAYLIFVWLSMTNIITSLFVDRAMKLAQPDLERCYSGSTYLMSTMHQN